ncbi:WXG100 family type VII secretion target [Micromonospora chalcea]|uniref:WXG100 family type VII secretion target n=1 Tax=Micromonospora chalcea TaxID=1874 RepID=UPI0021A6CE96|nr:hypothetical protein [Micromonospora chalcea]MCT2280458.1 hypothetical protein [Micromonospora chalcea]
MKPLDVDPEQVRAAGTGVRAVADQLDARWRELTTGAGAMGDIFGGDDVGGLIGASYQGAFGIAERSVTSVVAALTGFGDGLVRMADAYDRIESDNADLFRRLV